MSHDREIESLVSLLRSLEWSGRNLDDAACPCCGALRDVDLPANPERGYVFEPKGVHKDDCKLRRALAPSHPVL